LRLSKVDNIVALKDATGDVARGAALIGQLPDTFAVYSGDDPTALALMRHGAKGNISVTANVAAEAMAALCRYALAGDFDAAQRIDNQLQGLNKALFVEPNPIPVKWAMAEQGMMGGTLRLPLVTLSDEYHKPVRAALQQANL
jgi:4-hydroxy-tetrahydrodipicolinate synthase